MRPLQFWRLRAFLSPKKSGQDSFYSCVWVGVKVTVLFSCLAEALFLFFLTPNGFNKQRPLVSASSSQSGCCFLWVSLQPRSDVTHRVPPGPGRHIYQFLNIIFVSLYLLLSGKCKYWFWDRIENRTVMLLKESGFVSVFRGEKDVLCKWCVELNDFIKLEQLHDL